MATITDFGIPEVGTGILQPKLKNRWRVTFANIGGGANSSPISHQAVSVNRPSLTFEEIELHRYNSRAYIASKHSWEMMNLTIEDDISGTASAVIQEQLQSQQWLIGAEGSWLAAAAEGSAYKFATTLDLLDGNEGIVERWSLEGCFLQNVNYNELDYTGNEAVTITMAIRFDHARQDILGLASGEGVATGGAGTL